MSTPWSIEFNKNFLVRIKNELFEVFANSNLNWLVIGFGDGGGFKILLNLSSLDFGDESWEFVFACCSLKEIFVLLFSEIEDGWGILGIDSEILGESVEQSMAVVWLRDSEDDISNTGLIELLECLFGCGWFFIVGSEEEKGGSFLLENLLNGGVVKWDNLSVDDQQNTQKC